MTGGDGNPDPRGPGGRWSGPFPLERGFHVLGGLGVGLTAAGPPSGLF